MKMPDQIDPKMLAPCGVNCMLCYKHCNSKIPCDGCVVGIKGKPKHCFYCKIKLCSRERKMEYCYQCNNFPCKLIKNMEKSYKVRYGVSIIANSQQVKQIGGPEFMKEEEEKWTCSKCGGVISLQEGICSECKEIHVL